MLLVPAKLQDWHDRLAKVADEMATELANPTPDPVIPVPPKPKMAMGVNVNWVMDSPHSADILADAYKMGVRRVRKDVPWRGIEKYSGTTAPATHSYDWSVLDKWVAAYAKAGLTLQPMIYQPPPYARDIPANYNSSPKDQAAWAAFLVGLATRYGERNGGIRGEFWVANPSLPYLPFDIYEIWNEENAGDGSWIGTLLKAATKALLHALWVKDIDSVGRFAKLFRTAITTIVGVDEDAQVIIGGLTGGPSSMGNVAFLQKLMKIDPSLPVHGVGLHPYSMPFSAVVALIKDLRTGMDAIPGLQGVPIHVTEVGISRNQFDANGKSTIKDPSLSGSDVQIANLIDALVNDLIDQNLGVVQVIYHTATTKQKDPTTREDWFGLWDFNTGARLPGADALDEALAS